MTTLSLPPHRKSHGGRWLWIPVTLALGIYTWFQSDFGAPLSSLPEAGSIDERLAALEQNQSDLEERLDRATALLSSRKNARLSSLGSITDLAVSDAMPLTPLQHERQMADQATYYDNLFQRDRTDPAWSNQTEMAAITALQSKDMIQLGKPLAQTVDCRGAICRLSLIFADGMSANEWESQLPLSLSQNLPALRSLTLPLPDGRVELRLYGFRGGEEALNRATAGFSS